MFCFVASLRQSHTSVKSIALMNTSSCCCLRVRKRRSVIEALILFSRGPRRNWLTWSDHKNGPRFSGPLWFRPIPGGTLRQDLLRVVRKWCRLKKCFLNNNAWCFSQNFIKKKQKLHNSWTTPWTYHLNEHKFDCYRQLKVMYQERSEGQYLAD